jgi:HlyD family secretion protein
VFDGVVAEVNASLGDIVSSGTSVLTLITNQKIAEITLNEIDVAQIKIGQKANLTFDAVEDLSVTGEVAEISTLGAVNSGVVSYDIKIAFDIQDERIKPGMSVSVNIITDSKTDVLLIPVNAIKTTGSTSYVEIMVDGQLQRQIVTTGLNNDTSIEVEGLEEGAEIVSGTTSGSSSNSASKTITNNSNRPDGGMMMMMR